MFDESELPFVSARPRIFLDGSEDPALQANLLALSVETAEMAPDRCTARFANWGQGEEEIGYLYFDLNPLDFGRELQVQDASEGELFRGRILALEAFYPQDQTPEIQIVAEDGLQALDADRRTRSFESMSDADVFEAIASEYGLPVDLHIFSAVDPLPLLTQVDQSDLAFLRQRAHRNGWVFWLDEGDLLVQERVPLVPGGHTLTLGRDLRAFWGRADVRGQVAELRVSGWDVAAKVPLEEAARLADLGELWSGISGPRTVEERFGARPFYQVDQGPLNSSQANALARTRFGERARRFVTGRGVADGDGQIRVGSQVDLHGLGELFDGPHYVLAVRHTFDREGGFRTEFLVERPWLAPVPRRAIGGRRLKGRDRRPEQPEQKETGDETRLHQTIEDSPDLPQRDVVDDSHLKETRHARTERKP